jgi:hypothetical protein
MKTYKIKLEDKAAFLNRLEKAEVNVGSYEIVDNKLEGYFEITFTTPEDEEKAKTILRQSPKINKVTEMLRKLVREELKK